MTVFTVHRLLFVFEDLPVQLVGQRINGRVHVVRVGGSGYVGAGDVDGGFGLVGLGSGDRIT